MIGLLNYARRFGRSHPSRIGRIGLTDYAHQKPGRIDQVWEIISIKIGLGQNIPFKNWSDRFKTLRPSRPSRIDLSRKSLAGYGLQGLADYCPGLVG